MPELRDLLEEAAPRTRGPAPIEEIVRRGRRRSVTTRAGSAAVVLLALVAAVNLLPSPSRQPTVDEPRPDEDVRSVGGDVEVTMRQGFDGPAADEVAQRLDPDALPGTAEVLTWSETGLGRIDVVRYRTDGGEVTTEEDGELFTEVTGPHCLAVASTEGSVWPTCGSTPVDPGTGIRSGGVELLSWEGGCSLQQIGLRVPPETHEVVVSAVDGGSVRIRPHAGLAYARYPGYWGAPVSASLYDPEGQLVASADLPDLGDPFGRGCDGEALIAATLGTATITVDGDRQGRHVAGHVRSLRGPQRWPARAGDELRVQLASFDEGVAVLVRVPFPPADPERTRVELRLPTLDPADPQPTFTATGSACQVDLPEAAERDVRGRIDCELVSDTGGTITAGIDLEVTVPAPEDD